MKLLLLDMENRVGAILCDWEIANLCKKGMVSPFRPENLNAGSLDVTLGNKFKVLAPTCNYLALFDDDSEPVPIGYKLIDMTDPSSFEYKEVETDQFVLPPNGFVLAILEESVTLPDNVSAKLFGRSSWARGGLDNSSAAAWLDAGFSGSVVLEIKNLTEYKQLLRSGQRCGQLVFYPHEIPDVPYGQKKTSKYMNQEGLQGSKGSN